MDIVSSLVCLAGCLVCPEQTVGLVRYPATAAPADSSVVTVTIQCVENTEQSSPSLSVTGICPTNCSSPPCACTPPRVIIKLADL